MCTYKQDGDMQWDLKQAHRLAHVIIEVPRPGGDWFPQKQTSSIRSAGKTRESGQPATLTQALSAGPTSTPGFPHV